MTSQFGPTNIAGMVNAPNVKMFAFCDAYTGILILAPPGTQYETLSSALASGEALEQAMPRIAGQLEGKKLSIDAEGVHRTFLDTVFDLGGVSPDDIEIVSVDDSRMLLLARGGKVDFAKPQGGAQTALLLSQGWYPIIGVEDLIRGLPAGDPRGVSGIGSSGLATSTDFFKKDPGTIYRTAGVMFRVIDGIQTDLQNGTDETLSTILPVIESAAAVKLGMDTLKEIYKTVDPMRNFEEQASFWVDKDDPFYYKNVYQPQIDAAQKGGVLPASKSLTPDDAFLAPKVYGDLAKYKSDYDGLVGNAASLTGDAKTLADDAAKQYQNRNYYDAYRFLNAAIDGK